MRISPVTNREDHSDSSNERIRVSTVQTVDVIDTILGIEPGSPAANLRAQKPEYITQDQNYYLAIFEPDAESRAAFPAAERALIAVRVASHTRSTAVVEWYSELARQLGATPAQVAEARVMDAIPFGSASYQAAVKRADLVTLHPDQTGPEHIDELKAAGLTPAGILALSQVIAFVSYQLRLIAGLRAFGVKA